MDAGKLTDRVAFDQPTSVPDGAGGTETAWQEIYRCWANFLYLRGSEPVQSARLRGRQPVVVTVYANKASLAITTTWLLRDLKRGEVFNIKTIVPTDDRGYLEITAESGGTV